MLLSGRIIPRQSLQCFHQSLRASRNTFRTSTSSAKTRIRQRHLQEAPPRRVRPPHSILRSRIAAPLEPQQSGIDATALLVAVALSAGVAYIASAYRDNPPPIHPIESQSDESTTVSKPDPFGAQQLDDSPNMPQLQPGRPGSLTAEQEVKLKEMWQATLEVFGVAHDDSHTNGTATPSSTTSDATADPKKKKKRLGIFGKKDKDSGAGSSDSGDNDKHGQTKEFQQALAQQTPEELRDAFWSMAKHDHPDALLLRFLRARKWDVHGALVMLVSTMHWRSREMHVDDDIMIHGEAHALHQATAATTAAEKKEGADFLSQLRMGKSFLHGSDKEGRPCCYVRVRLHRQGEQSEPSLERFTVYTIETARMLLRSPVDTATIVFDMTDFSMANMDYTPVKFMIKCFEANYPESLGSVLVYKAPFIFRGIWNIIKGWLDPVVASKVHFASNVNDLSQWIPRDQIMTELGGDEKYTYTYIEPRPDENSTMTSPDSSSTKAQLLSERKSLVQSYESETISWMHDSSSSSSSSLAEARTRIAAQLADNYWKLDPYVRARSLYDRQGVLREGGKLDFYPKEHGGVVAGGGGQSHPETREDDVD